MIKITIPNNNLEERKYVLDIIFYEFLGLEYKLEVQSNSVESNWKIELENGNELIIEDHFFNKYPQDFDYLKLENIPSKVEFAKSEFSPEDDIPVIYGSSRELETKIINQKQDILICKADLFASSFFMLSRWEEYVNKNRDRHDRFSAMESLAFKNGFLYRPVVNEYVELIKKMLIYLGLNQKPKSKNFQLFVSCDVDHPFDCTVENIKNFIRVGIGDLVKRRSLKEFGKRLRRYIFNKFKIYKYDENYTFDWYMDICDNKDIKAIFYFIPTSIEVQNGCYELKDKKIQKLIKKIYTRGHEIGVHGSYQTYKDKVKTKLQKNLLDNTLISLNLSQKILENRQHYLRWDSAITPGVLEYSDFEYDNTGSYADRPGFRYGICYEFSMFDFLNRRKLNIKQRPLIVMECSVIDSSYMGLGNTQEALQVMKDLKQKCRKYDGVFSILWHNDRLKTKEDRLLFKYIISD